MGLYLLMHGLIVEQILLMCCGELHVTGALILCYMIMRSFVELWNKSAGMVIDEWNCMAN
jgi:hypothetical protein